MFIVLLIVGDFKMDTWKRDLSEMDRCKSEALYKRELMEREEELEKLEKKEGEFKELGRKIEKCEGEMGRLRSVPLEDREGKVNDEIQAVHATILECRSAIDDGLKRVKEAVGKTDLS